MEEERTWMLSAKKINGEATGEELRELEDSLKANPELNFTINIFYAMWNEGKEKQPDEEEVRDLLRKIKKAISE